VHSIAFAIHFLNVLNSSVFIISCVCVCVFFLQIRYAFTVGASFG
jgi:hypothetical protein